MNPISASREPLIIKSSFSVEETLSSQASLRAKLEKKKRRKYKRKLFLRHHRGHWEEMIRGTFPIFVAATINTVVQQILDLIVGAGGIYLQLVVNFVYACFVAHVLGYLVAYFVPADHLASDYYSSLASDNAAFAWSSFLTLVIMNWVYSDYPIYDTVIAWICLVIFVIIFLYGANYLQAKLWKSQLALRRRLRDFESDCFALAVAYSFTVIIAASVYHDSATDYLSNTDDMDEKILRNDENDPTHAGGNYSWIFFVYTACATLALFAYQWQLDKYIRFKTAQRQSQLLLQERVVSSSFANAFSHNNVAPVVGSSSPSPSPSPSPSSSFSEKSNSCNQSHSSKIQNKGSGYQFVTTAKSTTATTVTSASMTNPSLHKANSSSIIATSSSTAPNSSSHPPSRSYVYNIVHEDDGDDEEEDDYSIHSDEDEAEEEEELGAALPSQQTSFRQAKDSLRLDMHIVDESDYDNEEEDKQDSDSRRSPQYQQPELKVVSGYYVLEGEDSRTFLLGPRGSLKRRFYSCCFPWDKDRHGILAYKRCFYTTLAYMVGCAWHVWCELSLQPVFAHVPYGDILSYFLFAAIASVCVAVVLTLVSVQKEWAGLRALPIDTLSSWFVRSTSRPSPSPTSHHQSTMTPITSWGEMESLLYVTFGRLTVGWAWNTLFSEVIADMVVPSHRVHLQSHRVGLLLALRLCMAGLAIYMGYLVEVWFARKRAKRTKNNTQHYASRMNQLVQNPTVRTEREHSINMRL
jgi:hypothetical protein